MATKTFARNHFYMWCVGWGIIIAGGLMLVLNASFTIAAFRDSGLNDTLTYGVTIYISLLESAISIFLTSPSVWVEVAGDLQEQTQETIGSFSGVGRIAAAIIAALLTGSLISLIVATYWIDYQSTLEGLGIGTGENNPYKSLLAALLVWGTEAASILGCQVLRLARQTAIQQQEEEGRLEPLRIYTSEVRKHNIKQARAHARSTQWNPNRGK